VPQIRIRDAALYLGVSDDTVRRWIEAGLLGSARDDSGRTVVDGFELAQLAKQNAVLPTDPSGVAGSARNRFVGLVTDIVADRVMAQVELQCGPHRVVSLISSEAVRKLGLELGSVAVAVVKATNVIVEAPAGRGATGASR
jgi:molybdopterin-binding protein